MFMFALGQEYSVDKIPPFIKTNAKAVVRKNETILELKSLNKLRMHVHFAITILNGNGIDDSFFIKSYDKYSKLGSISGIVYDQYGNKIKKIKSDEIEDYSAISRYSLFEDRRVKFIDPEYRTTPFTVEYSYIVNYNGIFEYPDFYLFSDYNVSVEKSTFKIQNENGISFRVKEKNINEENKIAGEDYMWSFTNIPALNSEKFSPPAIEVVPSIQITPDEFEIEGYTGKNDSWIDFGKWIHFLNEGRDELEPETREKMKNLVKNATTKFDSVCIIYDYMQNKTRYVSIQIGIGGWQPIDAVTVDKLGYGDCKALVNYTKALLKSVGIESIYTLVNAGSETAPIMEDFPSSQFNHVILCLPMNNDTMWLECTSQDIPCGYTGNFTLDRKVLLITNNGGKLTNTKKTTANENLKSRNATVILQDDGNLSVTITSKYTGIYYDAMKPILSINNEDLRKKVISSIKIPNINLIDFKYSLTNEIHPEIHEILELDVNSYSVKIKNQDLLRLNLLNVQEFISSTTCQRTSPIYVRWPTKEIDTITYILPNNYLLDYLPDEEIIYSEFGTYHSKVNFEKNKIYYIRSLTINMGIFPADKYIEYIDFLNRISNNDNKKASIII